MPTMVRTYPFNIFTFNPVTRLNEESPVRKRCSDPNCKQLAACNESGVFSPCLTRILIVCWSKR